MRFRFTLFFFLPLIIYAQDPLFDEISDIAGTGNGINNNGVIIGDFDGDGYEDMFVPSRLGENRLFQNNRDGTFEDITDFAGIEKEGLTMTGSWADIDNDGDLDLFIGNYYTVTAPYNNYLYRNDGDGRFEDISEMAGVNTNSQSRSVHMVDVNLDGYTDIYVCNLLQQNTLWENNGDNTFSNRTFAYGLSDTKLSMGAVFFDYDNDGDQDVYLTHDGNQAYIMYENNGQGRFVDVSISSNLNMVGQGMGVDVGDVNNDGYLDIYVTNLGPNFLMLNNGNSTFTDIATQIGVEDPSGMGWGVFFMDYDNDGWEDIYVVNDSNFNPATNKLFKNNGDLSFTLVSEGHPLSSFYAGRAGTWGDFNNDGALEIAVANNQEDIGVQIFENKNFQNNWIGFQLKGTSVAPDAFGTRISVSTISGVKIDEKTGGSSYASQCSHRVYFGLGLGEAKDITITWPDGSTDFFSELDANEIHSITQGMSSSDLDGDSYTDDVDCDDTNPNVNPGATETPYNGIDDDCNPLTYDDDLDQDGFLLQDDCDDMNPNANPNLAEQTYNGIDDDCNPLTLDDDLDGDGFLLSDDCDDMNATVNPNVTEVTYNGIDDDCDVSTLDDDLDQDGFTLAEDCDDNNASINSSITEIPYNGLDDDCDASTLDDDLDQDGFTLAEDCDDTNASVNPGMVEIPNNDLDDNCDGMVDETSSIDLIEQSLIEVFPNPCFDHLYIQSSENIKSIQLYNPEGDLIISTYETDLNLSHLPSSVYILKTQTSNGYLISRILKI